MATKSLSIKYGAAAIVMALAIIGTSLFVNNSVTPTGTAVGKGLTNFIVMLTDPPTVPYGTTELNVTYSSIQLHVIARDGTSNWVASQESGRVNLLSLVNVTQTIATLSLPTNSTVDKLQFTLSSATSNVSGVVYPVTLLSNQLLINIRSVKLNGTTTGALIDLRPTLIEINASNSTGGSVKYFVLSPSATAVVKSSVNETQKSIGCRVRLQDKENKEIADEYRRSSNNVTITDAKFSVKGNTTTLSVTIKNIGKANATLSSLTMNGEFNTTFSWVVKTQFTMGKNDMMSGGNMMKDHPESIPFKISGGKLIPIFGDNEVDNGLGAGKLVIKPGQSTTLTYTGVLQLRSDGRGKSPSVVVTPMVGKEYTVRIMSTGNQSLKVTAVKGT